MWQIRSDVSEELANLFREDPTWTQERAGSSKTPVSIYQTTRRHITDDGNLKTEHSEMLEAQNAENSHN
jgi:hypothetical protein